MDHAQTESSLRIAAAQLAPVFLDRAATLAKVVRAIQEASAQGAALVAFGETLVPGYPAWICKTDGARFNAPDQKALHARYLEQAVTLEEGHLDEVAAAARAGRIAVVLGIAERPLDRGGHTIYCARAFFGADGAVRSVHRKLMPTYEERLSWGTGDGAGLVTHRVGQFTVGTLLCWENWMPLARAALYAAGENLHVALWPGADSITRDITRLIAREGRSYVLSVSGLLRAEDIPADIPERARFVPAQGGVLYNGGSCLAGPDGQWLIEPILGEERVVVADLALDRVREERQNFDPAGHYARPDVFRLQVDRRRQRAAEFTD
ncbi:MAG TPA: carbon-nitrogen hydrolase family protein [Gemmatimonadales bacterium]|jgi:nitrilase|nr:carbon-nitrogen hydrolase family protein [Gemmatimonadales bacterium]